MNQCIKRNKFANYFQQSSSNSLTTLKSASKKAPISNTSILSEQNSCLVDFCSCDPLYQQLIENSSSSSSSPSNTSSSMQFITSSNLHMQMPAISESNHSNKIFTSSSNSTEIDYKNNNRKIDLAATIKIPRITLMNSTNEHLPNTSRVISTSIPDSEVILNKRHHFSTTHENNDDYTTNYKLSNFFIRIEQIPKVWMMDSKNDKCIKDNDTNKKSVAIINRKARASPVLRSFLKSSRKQVGTNLLSNTKSNQTDINDNRNKKSPQYRPRQSYSYSLKTKITSKTERNKTLTMSEQSRRSPILSRRPQLQIERITDFDFDIDTTHLTILPMSTIALDTNESIVSMSDQEKNQPFNENQTIKSLSSSTVKKNNKRSFESSSCEQIFVKRRYHKTIPTIITQKYLCISYPKDIPRCVDCRTNTASAVSTQLASCRFQHCRTLKYVGDDKYEIEGFTTIDKAKSKDIQYLLIPNSGDQPPLNFTNANYIFIQLAKIFCLIFLHEENVRSTQNQKSIVWKQYMAGWREVCDECSTTLFNYHYMCKECGYMLCIECSNELSQISGEKRKKIKRLCTHDNTYSLSEFFPWESLIKLRKDCSDYLSKLNMDCSIQLYPSLKNENLSVFIKSLKVKRSADMRHVKQNWSSIDCNYDSNIQFYCDGRLPVFNEWTSENAKCFFRKVWSASCPVLVKRVHHNLSKTLWHPNSFKLHMTDHHETPLLWDCETLAPIQTNEEILKNFWEGFERLDIRLKDDEHGGRSRILKLKDWPTKKDFASVFPERLHDLMSNIPFSDYTRRSYIHGGVTYNAGVLNIVERLPTSVVKPDLGPKLYIAYSQLKSKESKKAGTTNLHIDVSDAVNVLVYVGIGGRGNDGSDKEEEIRQVEVEILGSNIDEAQLQRLRNGERPGALWHLFRSDDANKIREYISRNQRKISGSDSIHDQTAYLEQEDLEKLRDLSNVEAYPVLQFFGDAVFIPSGAPHQVKNLHSCIKIAEDFVSPENLDRCLITTNEFRSLSKTHTNHADILQAKNILFYTIRDALNSLSESNGSETTQETSILGVLN
ncbi:unnamed protein product [Rotaria socialis]|nr:unnamed protein product [Rotaria socialis]